jgi:formylglycine-generating enzyme required for sulfatase activity
MDCPVEMVGWIDVQQFILALNQQSGFVYRLPTEAEWEYAARGGNLSQQYKYSGSNDLNVVGWNYENSGITTHIVASKTSNELGLYDMSGNVREWCSDWYASDYYEYSPQNSPQGPSTGTHRVNRGGSWNGSIPGCRVSARNSGTPENGYGGIGFRLVLTSQVK